MEFVLLNNFWERKKRNKQETNEKGWNDELTIPPTNKQLALLHFAHSIIEEPENQLITFQIIYAVNDAKKLFHE